MIVYFVQIIAGCFSTEQTKRDFFNWAFGALWGDLAHIVNHIDFKVMTEHDKRPILETIRFEMLYSDIIGEGQNEDFTKRQQPYLRVISFVHDTKDELIKLRETCKEENVEFPELFEIRVFEGKEIVATE